MGISEILQGILIFMGASWATIVMFLIFLSDGMTIEDFMKYLGYITAATFGMVVIVLLMARNVFGVW